MCQNICNHYIIIIYLINKALIFDAYHHNLFISHWQLCSALLCSSSFTFYSLFFFSDPLCIVPCSCFALFIYNNKFDANHSISILPSKKFLTYTPQRIKFIAISISDRLKIYIIQSTKNCQHSIEKSE